MKLGTSVQKFAVGFGIVYALIGLLGFVPGVLQPPPADAPGLSVSTAYGYMLGVFPLNVLHDLVHIVVGVIGIAMAGRLVAARTYCRAVAIVFAVLTIMGLVPGLDTTFGLIPIFGADVLLHAVTTVASAYFGWMAPETSRRAAVAHRGA
jgi:hypothetical protein